MHPSDRKVSISNALLVRADTTRRRLFDHFSLNDLGQKARQPTKEGFIAFRRYVAYPQFSMDNSGIVTEDDIGALRYATPTHHMEWLDALITEQYNRFLVGVAGDDTCILSPRGSAKSSLIVELIAWLIGIHTAKRIPLKLLMVSFSLTISCQKSQQIQRILESDHYRHIFPMVAPGKKWTAEYWEIDKKYAGMTNVGEPYTMCCSGLTGSITSKRAAIIILDDLIKSPNDIANPLVREQMSLAFNQTIKPCLFPGGRIWCVGTRMLGDDIYATDFTKEKGWNVIEQSAILCDDQGHEYSYWKDWWSIEQLRELRDPPKGDPVAFSFQYQNVIVPIDAVSIPPEWIHFVDPLPYYEYESIAIGSDFSSALKEKSDFTVFTIIGRTHDGNYHILRTYRERSAGNLIKIQKLLEMLCDVGILEISEDIPPPNYAFSHIYVCEKPYFLTWWIENQATQQAIKLDFDDLVRHKMKLRNIESQLYRPRGDKRQRLLGITSGLQLGKIAFNRFEYNFQSATIQELLHFGSSHDDCVDALTLGILAMGFRPPLSC